MDANDPSIYRQLDRPISVQTSDRESYFVGRYKQRESLGADGDPNYMGPFHYSAHYSNKAIVSALLVRVPPFAKEFVEFQKGFDFADRAFHCVGTSYRLATVDSASDFRELIPELFYQAEMFVNREGFDLGLRQNKIAIDNVKLPPWAREDPRLFIKVHRQVQSWVLFLLL